MHFMYIIYNVLSCTIQSTREGERESDIKKPTTNKQSTFRPLGLTISFDV